MKVGSESESDVEMDEEITGREQREQKIYRGISGPLNVSIEQQLKYKGSLTACYHMPQIPQPHQ